MNLYSYKLRYYSDYKGDEEDEVGVVIANNFSEAMEKIQEDYGDYIDNIHLKYINSNCKTITIPEEVMDTVVEANYY